MVLRVLINFRIGRKQRRPNFLVLLSVRLACLLASHLCSCATLVSSLGECLVWCCSVQISRVLCAGSSTVPLPRLLASSNLLWLACVCPACSFVSAVSFSPTLRCVECDRRQVADCCSPYHCSSAAPLLLCSVDSFNSPPLPLTTMGLLSMLKKLKKSSKELRILLLGLDNAGEKRGTAEREQSVECSRRGDTSQSRESSDKHAARCSTRMLAHTCSGEETGMERLSHPCRRRLAAPSSD